MVRHHAKRAFHFSSVFLVAFVLGCCGQAIAQFSYRYYNMKAESYKGRLEGDKPENDLDMELACAPQPGKQNRCTVMLTPEFQRLKGDKQKCDIDLLACQQSKN